MNDQLLREISAKLDKLIAVNAIQGKDIDQQLKILKSLNFTYKDISQLTGVPEGTLKSKDHKKRKSK